MEDLLIEILQGICPVVIRQGTMAQDAIYPNDFFTFWNDASDGDGFYDNTENAIVWSYAVCFYSTSPSKVYSELKEAKKRLKQAGFIVTGSGYDVMSDEPTHTGRGIDVYFREQN